MLSTDERIRSLSKRLEGAALRPRPKERETRTTGGKSSFGQAGRPASAQATKGTVESANNMRLSGKDAKNKETQASTRQVQSKNDLDSVVLSEALDVRKTGQNLDRPAPRAPKQYVSASERPPTGSSYSVQ